MTKKQKESFKRRSKAMKKVWAKKKAIKTTIEQGIKIHEEPTQLFDVPPGKYGVVHENDMPSEVPIEERLKRLQEENQYLYKDNSKLRSKIRMLDKLADASNLINYSIRQTLDNDL